MKGIRFLDFHSFDDFGLVLVSSEIGTPEVKTHKIDIEGADSALDYTEYFGEPKYSDVKHKFQFEIKPQDESLPLVSRVKNAIHGKKGRIILDADPSWYYMGRCFVSGFTSSRGIGKISVDCECEPYKCKLAKTTVSKAVTGTQAITLTNGRKRAVPEVTISTDGTMRIVYQTVNVWDLGSGSFTLPELELAEGDNVVTVTGTGTVTFTWQEGDL